MNRFRPAFLLTSLALLCLAAALAEKLVPPDAARTPRLILVVSKL